MTILYCPNVLNENGEHELVSSKHYLQPLLMCEFIIAMVCARNTRVLHWLSYITGIVCYLCVTDMFTGCSIIGISGYWKANGTISVITHCC